MSVIGGGVNKPKEGGADSSWSSVNEHTLLLHDDLLRLIDHIPLPSRVGGAAGGGDEDYGLPVLDGKSPEELSSIISRECGIRSTTYMSLMEYRLNALKGLWAWLKSKEKKGVVKKTTEDGVSNVKTTPKGEGFASRISLVLIFPILHSLSKVDPSLSCETAKILLDSLSNCEPVSLSKEPTDCILGLENLLCSWLTAAKEGVESDEIQIRTAASALVALAVAVGTGGLLLRTVHTLQSLDSIHTNLTLSVPNVLHKLLMEHINVEEPSVIVADSHTNCWSYQYQDSTTTTSTTGTASGGGDEICPRSIAYCGRHVYVTSTSGKRILKLGTGIRGTLRGYLYTSAEVEIGWLVQCKGILLYRKKSYDDTPTEQHFCIKLDDQLKESGCVVSSLAPPTEGYSTVHFMSDGLRLYWIYVMRGQETKRGGDKSKYHCVYLQVMELNVSDLTLTPLSPRLLLQRSTDDKGNDVMKALMRAGSTYSSSFSAVLSGTKDDPATSCGLGLKQLKTSSAYCTGSSLILITAPPTSSSGRSLFGSAVSNSMGKALCVSFGYNLTSGVLVSQAELSPLPSLQCGLSRGGNIQSLGASYDSFNHCIWTVCDEWIDIWTCVGRVRPAAHLLAIRMGHTSQDTLIPSPPPLSSPISNTLHVQEAISLLLRHSGMESCRLTPGRDFGSPISHNLSLNFLTHCCSILHYCVENRQDENALTCLITLQAVLPSFLSSDKYSQEEVTKLIERVRISCWELMNREGCSSVIIIETYRLISQNCERLYLSDVTQSETLLSHLLTSTSPQLISLKEDIFVEVAKELSSLSSLSPSLFHLTQLLSHSIETDIISTLDQLREGRGVTVVLAMQPEFSPALQCCSAMLNASLRGLSSSVGELKELKGKGESNEDMNELIGKREELEKLVETNRQLLIDLCRDLKLFELCEKFLSGLCDITSSLILTSPSNESTNSTSSTEGGGEGEREGEREGDSTQNRQQLILALERASKGSVLGCLLPPLLAVMSDPLMCSLTLANTVLPHVTNLGKKNAECCNSIYTDYSNITIPAPWASGRLIETIHPVRDNYKFKETVSFPGARHLYLKFDPRSSSQYDYDKVIVYSGDSPSSTKVAEYGGNTHGFGSRSVLGKGWPKELVKVDGDTVTFSFEMKSGREHSTPDKAMWGFACTVRPQETAEDASTGLPFLLDLYLSISSITCSLISQLFDGAPPTAEEIKCESLMESLLLQRCVWPESEVGVVKHTPYRKPLQSNALHKLRGLACRPRPVLRPTISDLLQVDLLEDVIISTCLKHKGAESIFSLLLSGELNDEDRLLLEDIFTRINGLERRLQALAELESQWYNDVEEITSNDDRDITSAFFFDLQQQESTVKQFELLCCLMAVDQSLDTFSSVKQLQELMEKDIQRRKDQKDVEIDVHSKTRSIVQGILDRARLLLQVNISRSSSSITTPPMSRSMSVPANHLGAPSIIRQRSDGSSVSSLLIDSLTEGAQQSLLDEIFQFIGTKPEEAVSCDSFLIAANQQRRRGLDRVRALEFLRAVLTSTHLPTLIEHLLACVGGVLRNGPCVKDIACSGHVSEVRSAFGDVMQAVVELASNQPAPCINTIALLSIVPYTREEESCLVKSGLVKLLDRLCSMSDLPINSGGGEGEGGEGEGEAVLRVTTLAWAAFQVLADRCVSWETKSIGFISSGLAQQVSLLLTNHLSRAMDTLVTSESGSSETLQEALSMLLGLARSYMGRTILSQPGCVSKLLLLLTDQRPSPKLVLIALQLCRIALPLMTIAECSQVIIPSHPTLSSLPLSTNLASKIITLLMAKLAEYMTPSHTPLRNRQEVTDSPTEETVSLVLPSQQDEIDESGHASVYIYRRNSENAAEILQLLLNQDPRQLAHRMETVLRLDQSLTDEGKAEILTDSYRVCFRRSIRWANMGFTVSIEPPAGTTSEPSGTESDRKRAKAESSCKKKNLELLKTDPPRPFLSGTVAYLLASEIIGLLNGLLADHDAAQVWKNAIQDVIQSSLESVPKSLPKLEHYCTLVHQAVDKCEAPPTPDVQLSAASIANACFAALGGFKDTLRPNMKVEVIGEGLEEGQVGVVNSISEQRGVANVQFEDKYCFGVNSTLEVPLSRLHPPHIGSLPLRQLELETSLCHALVCVLGTSSLTISNPHTGMDGSGEGMSYCRLYAELRTRATMCLSHQLSIDEEFKKLFVSECGDLQQLRRQTELVKPGQRLSVVEGHCMGLRMLYRDCSRPAAPKIERPRVERKRFYLDITRSWPVVTYCSFSHHLTSLVYQGATTSTGGGANSTVTPPTSGGGEEEGSGSGQDKPKGAYIVTNNPIPSHAPSFYWEIEINQLDSGSSAPHLTFGLCPAPNKPPEGGVWSYAEETCLFRNTGRGFQVRGEDRMRWNKITIDNPLKSGDVVGCGWLKEDTPTTKGVVYFTINGTRLEQTFKDCPSGLYPFIHVQKKGIRLKLNFGDRCFAYQEGHTHRDAADVNKGDSLEEIVALFRELPFADYDPEGEGDEEIDNTASLITKRTATDKGDMSEGEGEKFKPEPLVVGPPCITLTPPTLTEAYDYKTSSLYWSQYSFDTMLESGPLIRPGGGANQEEEELEEGGGEGGANEDDLHSLLVKAWESKVFPLIQRRFRNDQERKSGLEQIRGALQLGMESIAQETVEFLYEENGGLPQDLHFPTMDEVKADLDKFTISRVKKGSAVVIQKELPYSRCGVRAMQKTQGLTGVVLSVDELNELVQVECYVPSDGALVRFWYPVVYLERPPKGYRKPSALRGAESVNILVHRELLNCESTLTAIYCRSSLLSLNSLSSLLSFPEYITLLSQHYFTQPSVEGTCSTSSPLLSSLLSCCLSRAPHSLFFNNHCDEIVQNEILTCLNTHQSSDTLPLVVKLTEGASQVGGVCGRGQFDIPEGREVTDVYCPEASFLLLSTAEVKPGSGKNNSTYKYPWSKVFTYRGGQGKAGRMLLQEVSRYPNEIQQQSVNTQYCGDTYPSLILPVNRLYLKLIGSTPPPGQRIIIHGISTMLPVLLNVCDTLSSSFAHHSNSLGTCVMPLIKIMSSIDWPLNVRIILNHTLSNVLWTLSKGDVLDHTPLLPVDLLTSLGQELEALYETECESFLVVNGNGEKVKPKGPPFPPGGSIAVGGAGRFSNYFQSLLELVLAGWSYNKSHAHSEATPTTSNGKKKGKKFNWLTYVKRASELLFSLANGDSQINDEFYRCFYKSLPSHPQSCLLVITGLNPELGGAVAMETIKKICQSYGGLIDVYIPLKEKSKDGEKEKVGEESTSESANDTPHLSDEKATSTTNKESIATPTTNEESITMPVMVVKGGGVIRLRSGAKTSNISTSLLASRVLQGEGNSLSVLSVSDSLKCGEDELATEILNSYLKELLYTEEGRLKEGPRLILTEIFKSAKSEKVYHKSLIREGGNETLLQCFLQSHTHKEGHTPKESLVSLLKEMSGEDTPLTEDIFIRWIEKEGIKNVTLIWCGLLRVGYDFEFKRCGFLPAEARERCSLSSALDSALILHVDSTCRQLDVISSNLQPWELNINDTELTAQHMIPLQGLSIDDIRMRFIALKNINRQLSWLLSLVDLSSTHPSSLGARLSCIPHYMFYDKKTSFLHSVLNAATRRTLDQAPPEIKMDPLENVGGLPSTVLGTQFCQAARQMLTVPSSQLCVPLASGGDPTYAFNVKLSGEEVHGTSGSFRHFLWQVVRELQSPLLPILIQCPSSAAGINKGKHVLSTGAMSYSEEKLLIFFGQLLGVVIRADVPIALDLLPCFWKCVKGEILSVEDLKETDYITYSYTKNIIEAKDETSFNELITHDNTETHSHTGIMRTDSHTGIMRTESHTAALRFTYQSLRGETEELVTNGNELLVNYGNRIEYAEAVRAYRLKELSSIDRYRAVRCGLGSVIPLELLNVFTPNDIDLRVCGVPNVDLQYLKSHTTYHVGLMETDVHIQYFWTALETLSQEELRKFIKFACNQERIPFGHPCRGSGEVINVPPYPMKIAPPDGQGSPDSRYIRAETCMFLIKLPQYSTQDIMTERLKYAINCREDPLSG